MKNTINQQNCNLSIMEIESILSIISKEQEKIIQKTRLCNDNSCNDDYSYIYEHILRCITSLKEHIDSLILLITNNNAITTQIITRSLYESYLQLLFFIVDKEKALGKMLCYKNVITNNAIVDIKEKIKICEENISAQKENLEVMKFQLIKMEEFYNKDMFLILGSRYRRKIDLNRKINNWYSIYDKKLNNLKTLSEGLCLYNTSNRWSLAYRNIYPQFSSFTHGFQGYNTLIHENDLNTSNLGAFNLVLTLVWYIFMDMVHYLNDFYLDKFKVLELLDSNVLISVQNKLNDIHRRV